VLTIVLVVCLLSPVDEGDNCGSGTNVVVDILYVV
jgi:hypothetical protein